MIFWMLWTVDALVASVFGYFFLVGLSDGTVSSFNIVLWLGILGGLAVVLVGGYLLKLKGQKVLALCLLALLAVPALLALVGLIVILITNPRWN